MHPALYTWHSHPWFSKVHHESTYKNGFYFSFFRPKMFLLLQVDENLHCGYIPDLMSGTVLHVNQGGTESSSTSRAKGDTFPFFFVSS